MISSAFICQNLLSDYVDGVLPKSREEEVKQYLSENSRSAEELEDLQSLLALLGELPPRPLGHELAIQITETCSSGRKSAFTRSRVSQTVMFLLVPILLFGASVAVFPKLFPWLTQFQAGPKAQFVRYFPLLQGASEIIEEHASWIHVRGPFMRSFWEEGGLSPEEFERAFSVTLPTSDFGDSPPE